MSYYVNDAGRSAEFKCNASNRQRARITAVVVGFAPLRANAEAQYPSYEIVKVGSSTELIEHRGMEPLFYVSDDAQLKRHLGVTANYVFPPTRLRARLNTALARFRRT